MNRPEVTWDDLSGCEQNQLQVLQSGSAAGTVQESLVGVQTETALEKKIEQYTVAA